MSGQKATPVHWARAARELGRRLGDSRRRRTSKQDSVTDSVIKCTVSDTGAGYEAEGEWAEDERRGLAWEMRQESERVQ